MSSTSLRIMVTRPGLGGEELCALIKAQGDQPIFFPTIEFASLVNEVSFQQALPLLGEQDWLIFNSPQAVYLSIPAIRQAWPAFPPQVQFAAVGGGTAQALKKCWLFSYIP